MEVINVGYNYSHNKEFEINRPNGTDYYVLLLLKTSAIFNINNEKFVAQKGSLLIYDIGIPQHYSANNETYTNDWFHFKMDNDFNFFSKLNIPFNTILNLPEPKIISALIKNMSIEKHSNSIYSDETLDCLLKILLMKVSQMISVTGRKQISNPHYQQFVNLRSKIYNSPYIKWNITDLANKFNLSPFYFQHLYKEFFNIACISDVIASRIEFAKYNLMNTNFSIKYIAHICGYDNEVHFMRQFKKQVGITPSEYRIYK